MDMNHLGGMLPLMESFYTIQGEGFHSGKAAFFIRLAGCDVGCVWCDVKESWDKEAHSISSVDTIIEQAKLSSTDLAVVTGGEPLMYDLSMLTDQLKKAGFKTHLETSGAYPVSGEWDWFCLSPKKFKQPLSEAFTLANELKIIVYNKSDFEWAAKMAAKVNSNCKLFLQPEWSQANIVMKQLIDYVKNNPNWEISLQVHKFMDIP